mgnify:CR=1 FL=1
MISSTRGSTVAERRARSVFQKFLVIYVLHESHSIQGCLALSSAGNISFKLTTNSPIGPTLNVNVHVTRTQSPQCTFSRLAS